jgi:hypothetical protein
MLHFWFEHFIEVAKGVDPITDLSTRVRGLYWSWVTMPMVSKGMFKSYIINLMVKGLFSSDGKFIL